ncbi:MAG TPA: hypothetical protein VE396_11760 [Xanthobacteraceae bacterium]|nr:hypothetical protein [Xanthobacteraceae bacterium]
MMTTEPIAFVWYTAPMWRALMSETAAPISYREYQVRANRAIADYERRGHKVIKIEMDLAAMTAWCHARGYQVDGTRLARAH